MTPHVRGTQEQPSSCTTPWARLSQVMSLEPIHQLVHIMVTTKALRSEHFKVIMTGAQEAGVASVAGSEGAAGLLAGFLQRAFSLKITPEGQQW